MRGFSRRRGANCPSQAAADCRHQPTMTGEWSGRPIPRRFSLHWQSHYFLLGALSSGASFMELTARISKCSVVRKDPRPQKRPRRRYPSLLGIAVAQLQAYLEYRVLLDAHPDSQGPSADFGRFVSLGLSSRGFYLRISERISTTSGDGVATTHPTDLSPVLSKRPVRRGSVRQSEIPR